MPGHGGDATGFQAHIVVEEQHQRESCGLKAALAGGTEAAVPVMLDQPDAGVIVSQPARGAVAAGILHHYDFGRSPPAAGIRARRHRRKEVSLEQLSSLPCRDHDREVHGAPKKAATNSTSFTNENVRLRS